MSQQLTDIQVDEVSPVFRGANRRKWSLRKDADGGDLELDPHVADALATPHDSEGAMIDALRKSGVDDDGQIAAVAIARLAKSLPAGVELVELLKAEPAAADDARQELAKEIEAFDGDDDAKAQLMKRAGELDAADLLPSDWAGTESTEKENGMAETGLNVPVQKEDGTWDLSGVAPEARPFYEMTLAKQADLETQNAVLVKLLEKSQEETATEREKRLEKEAVSKAAAFEHIAKADELGPVLQEVAEKCSPETVEKLEGFLTAAEARIVEGDLFKESGQTRMRLVKDTGNSDAWAKIEKAAEELVEKADQPLSKEQAIDRVLQTAAGKQLYADYVGEAVA